jgi:hypothetical protein
MRLGSLLGLGLTASSGLTAWAADVPATIPAMATREAAHLVITANGRHFARSDGRPFFWIGDTARELLHHATRAEIGAYLDDRAAKRFSVVQVCLLPEMDGLTRPNREGQLPFLNGDPAQPNPAWFDLADWFVTMAGDMGLQVALLPTWGSYVVRDEKPLFGAQPIFTPAKAEAYGRWLAERFQRRPNIVWMLGGDRDPEGHEPIWRALAAGLKAGSGERPPLITYHPRGPGSSGRTLHAEPWLAFNSVQSGHQLDGRAHELVLTEAARTPVKPVINAEPAYEGMPIGFDAKNGRFTADHVRRNWYWSVFSGAAGVIYGANEVWMAWAPDLEPLSAQVKPPFLGAQQHWTNALAYPGSSQLRFLRALTESRPWNLTVPDPALVYSPKTGGTNFIAALRATDGSTALLYLPQGGEVAVDLSMLTGQTLNGTWWSPSSGGTSHAGRFERQGNRVFKAPSGGFGQDWVLVIDDLAKGFGPAGQRPPRAKPVTK